MKHPLRPVSGLIGAVLLWTTGGLTAAETPVLMSPPWAFQACAAWNASKVLSEELHASGWAGNHNGRGHKVLQVYRSDCPDSPRVELHIADQDGRAHCVYGGAVATDPLDLDVDYVMHAETARWQEMGAGEYGPMKAMFFQYLLFDGPYMEAMGNMGPFGAFLKLTGEVPSTADRCP
jgi:putative sterol carrier protein